MLDEFVASLLMPGDRSLELQVYQRSLLPTAILLSVVLLILILLMSLLATFL